MEQQLLLCDLCDIAREQGQCVFYTAPRNVALCPACNDVTKMMVYMQYEQCWTTTTTTSSEQTSDMMRRDDGIINNNNATGQSEQTQRKARTIPAMLERIKRHKGYYTQLTYTMRHELGQIERFDRRRNKQDNDYVRNCYSILYPEEGVASGV